MDLRVHSPKKTAVVLSALPTAHFFLGSGIGSVVSGPGLRICDLFQLVVMATGNEAKYYSLAVPHLAGMGRAGSWQLPGESQFN